jgi:hypothetical protein
MRKNKKPAELDGFSGLESLGCYASSAKHPRPHNVCVMVMMTMSKINHKFTIAENIEYCQNKFV